MPFTIDSPDLPSNVQALDAELKTQWIEVFNSVLSSCQDEGADDCEGAAMTQANGVIKKRQEESMKFLEALATIREVSDGVVGALGDLRAAIEALEIEEAQSSSVMMALRAVEQMFMPKDDEEEPDEDEPDMEETTEPEAETASESFAESLPMGAITIIEAGEPKSVRDPLTIRMRLIKAGPGNPHDNHYYPGEVLRRDAHVFEGVKMYTTPHNENERSEENEVGKIRKIVEFEADGSPIADVNIFDPAFAEKTRNRAKSGDLDSLECSILGKGVTKEGAIGGHMYNVVETIESGQAVDFVPRAGAGGQAVGIAESADPPPEPEQLQLPETPTPEPETPKPLLEKERVLSVLRETNLPKPSQERLADIEYGTDEALSEAITQETEYVKSVTGSGQPLGGGATQPVTEKAKTPEQLAQESAERYEKIREKHGLPPR